MIIYDLDVGLRGLIEKKRPLKTEIDLVDKEIIS
jgi:hypothetical protein